MHNSSLYTLSVIVGLSLTIPTYAQSASEEATAMFEKAVAYPTVPGISVAIADQNGIIWAKGFGYADLEQQTPMTTKTKMRIGSVAKVFTTAALMRLYDKGKVDLDTDIRDYVPSWPKNHEKITLRHLTSHTSGIRHYSDNEFLSNATYDSVTESLNIFKDSPLKYSPGTNQSYSTYAWSLVSAAIEGADGANNFIEIVQNEVFTPLAMHDSSFDWKSKIISNRQRPYTVVNGKLMNAPQTDHSYKWAGGGFIASTSDVSRFAVAHTNTDYLKADTLKKMFTLAPYEVNEMRFGIGWRLGFGKLKDDAKRIAGEHSNSVMHSGGSTGGVTMMILCLDHKRAVTVVKNVDSERSVDVFMLALKTLDIFHEQ